MAVAPDLRSDETKYNDERVHKAVAAERERCAKIAEAHKGSAANKRRSRGPQSDYSILNEIYAEERGEDIAAEIIAREIRNLEA